IESEPSAGGATRDEAGTTVRATADAPEDTAGEASGRALAAEAPAAAREGVTMPLTPPAPPAPAGNTTADDTTAEEAAATAAPSPGDGVTAAPVTSTTEKNPGTPPAEGAPATPTREAPLPFAAEAPPRPPVTPPAPGGNAGPGFRRLSDLAREAGRGPYDYASGEPFAPHGPYAGYGRTPYPPVDSPYLRGVEEPAPRKPARQPKSKSFIGGLTICLALIVGGIMVAVQQSTGSPSMPVIGGAVLATIGTGLLIATWFGRGAGLVAAGVIVSLALVAGSTLGGFPKSVGSFTWHPSEISQPGREYAVGIGEGRLDLSDLKLAPGSRTRFDASVSIGQLVVIVPPDARVEVHGHARIGEVKIDHRVEDGMDVQFSRILEPEKSSGDAPTIELYVKAGIGDVDVRRSGDEPERVPDPLDRLLDGKTRGSGDTPPAEPRVPNRINVEVPSGA
ncbi:LiaF domain-containing protein, partial [Microtetraspora niveoalba]|uniref:LiaF domain-containing protein n=1 Tax=Microtetraspora niveoalba TaxID=46175 RepID=UPI000AEEB505